METLTPGWTVTGSYNEACAAEGHCPFYFGRDVDGGCRYFMVFRLQEGIVNGVDLSGITVVYNGDILHSKFADLMANGSEAGIYVSDNATEEQRSVLDTLVTSSLGGVLVGKNFGVRYVPIEVNETDNSITVKTPFGEMTQAQVTGANGGPVRIDNSTLPFLSDLKHCHTSNWSYVDHGKKFDYTDRCGSWADFAFSG
ncbi:MAG: DUF1326 domain-containing protein [Actinomycetia bacterium]|nr:DUF1326 domain-containing protein [Actinomycetes bacterium]